MGERKGQNKYYPPDWDPSKGSINQYVGQHPLRDRARKLGQGILIIRFEMPYNIWCGGCNNHIGMGVRYNAEKTKAGMYYTTPIYKFRMKCHLCDNHFVIQTDPKNHDYVILEGARRKEQRWDPKENEQIVPEDKATQKKLATDAMYKLEHGSDDVQKSKKAVATLSSLEGRRDEWKDDYFLNKLARQKFREEKKALKVEADSDQALLTRSSLDIPLQKEAEEDVRLAGLIKYRALESYDERQAQRRKEIESRPLFEPAGKVTKTESPSPERKKLDIIKRHLKQARNSSQINPFDRTKVNTLGVGGTTVTRKSLGIKKRSLPKFQSSPLIKTVSADKNSEQTEPLEDVVVIEDKGDCLSDSSEEPGSDESSVLLVSSGETSALSCRLHESNIKSESIDSSAVSTDSDLPETVCDKTTLPYNSNCDGNHIHENIDNCAKVNESTFQDESTSIKNDIVSNQNSLMSDTISDGDGNETKLTTGLGLVCSYLDSDSDT